jgi:hypothetical protein
MITKTGVVTVREEGVAIEHFYFENEESLLTAKLGAYEWAIKRLQKAIEEEKAAVAGDTLPGGSFTIDK